MSKATENRENSSTTQSDWLSEERTLWVTAEFPHSRLKHTPVTTATSQGPSDSQRYANVNQAQVSLQRHQQELSQSASSYLLELPQAVHLDRRTFLRLAAWEICTGSHRRRRVHGGKTGWTKRNASAWSWHFKRRSGRFSDCFFQQIGEKSNKRKKSWAVWAVLKSMRHRFSSVIRWCLAAWLSIRGLLALPPVYLERLKQLRLSDQLMQARWRAESDLLQEPLPMWCFERVVHDFNPRPWLFFCCLQVLFACIMWFYRCQTNKTHKPNSRLCLIAGMDLNYIFVASKADIWNETYLED